MAINARIETIEGDIATIKLEDGQIFRVPMESFEIPPSPETDIQLFLVPLQNTSNETPAIAKEVLKELLKK